MLECDVFRWMSSDGRLHPGRRYTRFQVEAPAPATKAKLASLKTRDPRKPSVLCEQYARMLGRYLSAEVRFLPEGPSGWPMHVLVTGGDRGPMPGVSYTRSFVSNAELEQALDVHLEVLEHPYQSVQRRQTHERLRIVPMEVLLLVADRQEVEGLY